MGAPQIGSKCTLFKQVKLVLISQFSHYTFFKDKHILYHLVLRLIALLVDFLVVVICSIAITNQNWWCLFSYSKINPLY